jgi:phosphate transport system substrate-binding protein
LLNTLKNEKYAGQDIPEKSPIFVPQSCHQSRRSYFQVRGWDMQPGPGVKRVLGLVAGLLLSLGLFISPAPVSADTLEIPGTGACEVLLQALARAFNAKHPGQQVVVPPSIGSVGGVRLVAGDRAIMGRVAQPLKNREKNLGLRYLVFARDMVIFAGGAKVTVKNLTLKQLQDVYSGKITKWQELGGAPGPIRLLLRQPGDSSLLIIREKLPQFRDIAFPPGAKVIHTDPKLLEVLQKYHYSLGWLTFSALQGAHSPIHPLALEGIAPTPKHARSRRYQLICDYALVFKETRLNDLARSFLDYIFSQDCGQLMEQYGVIPVGKE